MIEWKSDLEIGIPSADYEHRKLVDLFNELYSRSWESETPDAAAAALGRILSHFTSHFAVEEDAMRAARFDDIDRHVEQHERLLRRVDLELLAVKRGGHQPSAFVGDIELWLIEHFREWDVRLYVFLDRAG